MSQFHIRHKQLGDHVDCQLRVGEPGTPEFAMCGRFMMRVGEFEDFRRACPGIDFIADRTGLPGAPR